MRIFRRIERVLVVAMVLLAMLASACEDEVLDALVGNQEGEVKPESISGPRTVLVGAPAIFTVKPDPGGVRVRWGVDADVLGPELEEDGNVLTYVFREARNFVVSARLRREDGSFTGPPVSILVRAIDAQLLSIEGPVYLQPSSTGRYAAHLVGPKPEGSRVQWGVKPDGGVLRELDETSVEAAVVFDEPGSYAVSALLVGSDGSRLSNQATHRVSVEDRFDARLLCYARSEEGVYLDEYVLVDWDSRPTCRWKVFGGSPTAEVEVSVDRVVIANSTFNRSDPEDRRGRLFNLPALPPGPHVVTLRVTDSSGEVATDEQLLKWRWDDPSLAVKIVTPNADVEVAPGEPVSFEVDFRTNVDISTTGRYTVTWRFGDRVSLSDRFDSAEGSSFAKHSFDKAGRSYTVTVTVKDQEFKREGSAQRVVRVIAHEPPEVDAGADQTVTLPDSVNLAGTVTDDDKAEPFGDITISWSKVLGPGTVVFSNANTEQTTATFSKAGLYLLKLNASANEVSSADAVEITVEKQVVFTDVTGTWKTDYGTMELELDGISVTGTYTKENGAIVEAFLHGYLLTGFWVEDSSRVPCDSAKDERTSWGRISFKFNENFNKFTGKWLWCNQEPTENWNGRRN